MTLKTISTYRTQKEVTIKIFRPPKKYPSRDIVHYLSVPYVVDDIVGEVEMFEVLGAHQDPVGQHWYCVEGQVNVLLKNYSNCKSSLPVILN